MKRRYSYWVLLAVSLFSVTGLEAQPHRILSQPVDVSKDFTDLQNTLFFADSLAGWDAAQSAGKIEWKRKNLFVRQAFNTNTLLAQDLQMLDFPGEAYVQNPQLVFSIEFITPKTFRIKMLTSPVAPKEEESLMLDGEPATDNSWIYSKTADGHKYTSAYGSVEIVEYPFNIVIRDASGKLLTDTWRWKDNDSTQIKSIPFCFLKRGEDNSRAINPVFTLAPGEKIYGCGESPTGLNKRGQIVQLYTTDPQGPESSWMYKPIPFFMSSRGYGMFMHTSAPVTCDFGASYIGANKLFMGDENLDLFVFLGSPKEVLYEYTGITGRSPLPPLWSFGTWIGRITYFSQEEGYEVASKIRENNIPADVIHFDTGWFQTDWQVDYQFSKTRFNDPVKMLSDLKAQGFHVSLWQNSYFTPKNPFFDEIVEKGYYVHNDNGGMPYEDAVIDFSNPEAVRWYQDKLAGLLRQGVGAIKVDFGEGAPMQGFYASGKGGWYEHNLYPLRYNKAVADITKEITGDNIIWARSAWAGSQRYPLHWGGDVANTDNGLAATIRCGLSIGLSGFSYWSHDMGGFVQSCPEELYRRWLPLGFLCSHSRVHGAPPTEPWLYNQSFVDAFRDAANMKYRLMPYIYNQAKICSEQGLPMMRALFLEFPEDPGAWTVEDEYLFGADILVAPLLEQSTGREVYLPGGKWVDYQSGKSYAPGWHYIEAGKVEAVILVRDGAVIPHVKVAQSTDKIDFEHVENVKYKAK